eukprot:CAMPEP_0169473962 /NCGR_PEP_ID=MMETSP1042-20121227/25993_1 /TAXON_ID=464988 /ORGANISM="Hemiselmis andersenii, Strain CCMP1180" /LENGTH=34 /DNA_ID= /DNA_START= /DNA_END= /DNA_ORIENTATION=
MTPPVWDLLRAWAMCEMRRPTFPSCLLSTKYWRT